VRLLLWLFNRIGMSINESEQLYPERSTTAFAIYPVAKYLANSFKPRQFA
jgi:cobalamin-dependent methionine synthase I